MGAVRLENGYGGEGFHIILDVQMECHMLRATLVGYWKCLNIFNSLCNGAGCGCLRNEDFHMRGRRGNRRL